MLISTESMQAALWVSMNPMPPMSAARLYTQAVVVVVAGVVLLVGSGCRLRRRAETTRQRFDVDGADP